MVSKTTYYRRLQRARDLGCQIDELPDGRGKHKNHVRGHSHPRWNPGRILSPRGCVLIRVGRTHPLAYPNGYCPEHILVLECDHEWQHCLTVVRPHQTHRWLDHMQDASERLLREVRLARQTMQELEEESG
jgi:hypothetical protein